MVETFEPIEPECQATVNVTSFRYLGNTYTISTTEIISLKAIQHFHDIRAGYKGNTGNYETMLFINRDTVEYPFHDLPGHSGLGVFQRYETEDEARDGHQHFVTKVQRALMGEKQS